MDIGPHCVVGSGVTIGDGTVFRNNVVQKLIQPHFASQTHARNMEIGIFNACIVDAERRKVQAEFDSMRSRQKEMGKIIGQKKAKGEDATDLMKEMGNLPDLYYSIPDLARLELRAGNRSQAIELLGMARSQPELDSAASMRIEKAIAEFGEELGEEEVSEALIRGKRLELEEVILGYIGKE